MSDPNTSQSQLADFLPYQLSITSNAVSSVIASRYRARFGLKVPEWRVMAVLGDLGAATQRHLTEATLMDKVAVNRACKVLEERGLIARQPNMRDGRSHLLDLTGEGRAVHAEVMPLARESESEIFASLDEAQQEQLRALLEQVFEHAKSIRPASS
ncbi:MarR family winged helix-turn-helix transcriptional regulator [Erythrobacter sp. HA6-11]